MSESDHLHRAQLLEELLRKLKEPLKFDAFLATISSIASELIGCEAVSILEYDEDCGCLRFISVPWFHRDALSGMEVPLDGSIGGQVCRDLQPVVVQDVSKAANHFKRPDQKTGFETRSLLSVPVVFKGQVLGVMEVLNKADNAHYTEDDVTILEMLASLVGGIMSNKHLERQVQAVTDELAELDRLKNDFIAITSHELRTPLGLILGHATFLREVVDDEYSDQLDTIVRNATRLKDIIESLSNVDNYQSGVARIRRRSISLKRIIEDIVDSYSETAIRQKLKLETELGSEDLVIEGDAEKISTALGNLIKNALSFTDPDGRITVRGEALSGAVKVSVRDNGIGIPVNDLPRIFDRFYQAESHLTRRHGGMGLGLSVAKMMVEMHGGRIWAESVEGEGSTFIFVLPVSVQQAGAVQQFFARNS
ncbi:MAG: GAF domain-containing sensor histidine kinase [Anaerolineales bacterium]|nr:GAF domain-containing sensor histidine kinase [Anaerolineales bacterium]